MPHRMHLLLPSSSSIGLYSTNEKWRKSFKAVILWWISCRDGTTDITRTFHYGTPSDKMKVNSTFFWRETLIRILFLYDELKYEFVVVHYFLGCIECTRCRLLLPMFAVSVWQSVRPSVCHECTEWPRLGFTVRVIGGDGCSVRRVLCAQGHSVQPSPNAFDLLL